MLLLSLRRTWGRLRDGGLWAFRVYVSLGLSCLFLFETYSYF